MSQTEHPAEVVVVGAGIIGLACAHYLSELGSAVTVIDQGSIAGGCSHGNCGYVCPSHILPLQAPGMIRKGLKSMFSPRSPFRIKPQWRPELYRWLWQFARRCHTSHVLETAGHLQALLEASRSLYDELMVTHGASAQWQPLGLMYAFLSEQAMHDFSVDNEFMNKHFQVRAHELSQAQLADQHPALKPSLAGAFVYRQDAHLNPAAFANSWAVQLKSRGVRFLAHCQWQSMEQLNGRLLALHTSQGRITADHCVIATGAWSARMAAELQVKVPVEPGKGYSVTLPKPDSAPWMPVLFPERSVGITPLKGALRVGSMMEFAGFDDRLPPHRIRQLISSANRYLQQPLTAEPAEPWYGWRPMTWDSLPIIDRIPGLHNVVLATGHNMLGMSLAPITGQLVAALLHEQTPALDLRPFSINRF